MEVTFVSNIHDSYDIERVLEYKEVTLTRIDSEEVNDTNIGLIDFIPFNGIDFHFHPGGVSKNVYIREQIKGHYNFELSKNNPHIPIMLFHQHEVLIEEQLDLVSEIILKELNVPREKIIIMDSLLTKRDGMINPPIITKLNQYFLSIHKETPVRNKRFTFLNNKHTIIRFQMLDKILKFYQNDIDLLRSENVISFRNFNEDTFLPGEKLELDRFKHYYEVSEYYKFHNKLDFYQNIGFPWTFDYFEIGDVYPGMFLEAERLYAQSFFSLISETWVYYMKLEEDENIDEMHFSEKAFISLSAGTFPFIINHGKYYVELEKAGFDFSYLKTVFDIDYRENNIRENFDSIDKFLTVLKSKTIEELEVIYQSLKPILDKNISLIERVETREMPLSAENFFREIKNLK